MEYKNEKDFICRTKYNLELYRKSKVGESTDFNYEITQLINSFLGLIIFIKEKGIQENKNLNKFLYKNNPKIWNYKKRNKDEEEHDFKNYLRHLRNSIAHPKKLSTISKNGEIFSITFKDFSDKKFVRNEFETTLKIEQIDKLINLLSQEFFKYSICNEKGEII